MKRGWRDRDARASARAPMPRPEPPTWRTKARVVLLCASLPAFACSNAKLGAGGDGGPNEEPFCDAYRSTCAQEPSPTAEERADCRALLAGPCATEARANLQCLRDNELCTTAGRADPTFAIETCKLQSKAQRDCTSAAPPTDAGRDGD